MIILQNYKPHLGQIAFHYAINKLFRYIALITGIRAGKTYSGAREAGSQSWNATGRGVYGIIAPTFHMLKRTTWREYEEAMANLISTSNKTDFIIKLKNGREVHGFSADKPDRIRNATLCGFWLDEGRECKDGIWEILLGRVLSTGGKGILTSSPNSYDWIHRTFVEQKDPEYGLIRFPTTENTYLDPKAIESLRGKYDKKFAEQELGGEFVIFDGAVYYTFNRNKHSGDLAFNVAVYDSRYPICLCCDFNVNPMAWVLAQVKINSKGFRQAFVIDEIFIPNSNTEECCNEFKARYPQSIHKSGLVLYGDATGRQRSTTSNITNWKIIEQELANYGIKKKIPLANPAERDRINAVNATLCNSKGDVNALIHPRCQHLIGDLEQVSFKKGTCQIDKKKDESLTHPSDAFGYFIEREFSLNKAEIKGLKI